MTTASCQIREQPGLAHPIYLEVAMPTLDVTHWSRQRPWQAGYTVLATMLYPDDPPARREVFAVMQHKLIVLHWPAVNLLGLTLSLDDIGELLKTAEMCDSWLHVMAAAQRSLRYGVLAGVMLILLRQWHAYNREGNLSKAIYLVQQAADGERRELFPEGIVPGATDYRNLHTKTWKQYQSVAPWWAASIILKSTRERWGLDSRMSGHGFLTHPWFEEWSEFQLLCALADDFRGFGECHRARNRSPRSPKTLDQQTQWRLPPAYPVARVAVQVPPFDPDLEELLQAYDSTAIRFS